MASENHADLTCDAFPSPPREVNDTTKSSPSFDQENQATPKQNKTKQKKKKSTPSNNSNTYINISHCGNWHLGSTYIFNAAEKETANKHSVKKMPKTKAIQELLARTDPVPDKMVRFVSNNIGQGWKNFARLLHHSEADIFQVEENHLNEGLQEVVYQLIFNWRNKYPAENQVGKLVSALWNAEAYEIIELMVQEGG